MFLKKKIDHNLLKKTVAHEAIKYLKTGMIIGIGTGSTVNCLIQEIENKKYYFKNEYFVSSSEETSLKLKNIGLKVMDLNYFGEKIDIYIDGADESNYHLELIKGGGGALTREKICRVYSKQFICMIDITKIKKILGQFPLAIEVIPMARNYVTKELIKRIGGNPIYRENFITDNNNIILDIHNLKIDNPLETEKKINNITGIVSNGLFAEHPANILLIGDENRRVHIIDHDSSLNIFNSINIKNR